MPVTPKANAVEISLLCSPLSEALLDTLRRAMLGFRERFVSHFGLVRWEISISHETLGGGPRLTHRLERAVSYRDRVRQDFVIVIDAEPFEGTAAEDIVCATSRTTGVALLSLKPLQSRLLDSERAAEEARLVDMLSALLLQLLGGDPPLAELVSEYRTPSERSRSRGFESLRSSWFQDCVQDQDEQLRHALSEVADARLEERRRSYQSVGFAVLAAYMNRGRIWESIRAARPWLLPFRLRALTTAAVSAALFLLMTAEAWDLALQQRLPLVASASAVVIVTMSGVLFGTQRMRFGGARLTEQIIATNAAMAGIVVIGVVSTYVLLFALICGAGWLLFSDLLIAAWAPTLNRVVVWQDRLLHAGLMAAISLGIGALGASLEGAERVRSVVYLDDQ